MTKKLPRRWAKQVVLSGADRGAPATPRAPLDTEEGVAISSAASAHDAVQEAVNRAVLASGQLASGAPSSGVLARASIALPSLPGARALVVDDDPEIRRALVRLLGPELDVHIAGSVAQAEALLVGLDRVDVAFIDWELPDGTGEQILRRLAHWPDAIRVLISARASIENLLENRALANLVLGKPLALGVIEALKRAALALPQG